jgi:DNA-binding NtrC family response regulator
MKAAPEFIQAMMNYPWYGNIRELRNAIERLVVLKDNHTLNLEDLPDKIRQGEATVNRSKRRADGPTDGISFQTAVSEFEKALILNAMEKTNWVKNRAAELLQIKRTTLVEKMKRYGLEKPGDDV